MPLYPSISILRNDVMFDLCTVLAVGFSASRVIHPTLARSQAVCTFRGDGDCTSRYIKSTLYLLIQISIVLFFTKATTKEGRRVKIHLH